MKANSRFSLRPPALALLFLAVLTGGCVAEKSDEPFTARVGADYLYESDIVSAFDSAPVQSNGESARGQFIDRWVSSALLAQEARRRGIQLKPDVQRLLRDNERSILASALVDEIFDESLEAAKESAIQEYYEANRDRLRIREPYVEIRYLSSSDRTKAAEARRLLQRALRGAGVDSLWLQIVNEYADDPEGSQFLASNYFPQSRLFGSAQEVRERLLQLGTGQLAPVIDDSDVYHVLQLVDRQPSGTVPELAWIRDDLGRQREQQTQKDTYARLVQRLRTEAESRNEVEVR
ncbi:MAG: peptidyl-prolyl cis-trans isomerase [Rhodothermales bacterium]|nr:peptidyl-prolyl cis-trans isomerase [Rhodothermales bacterium]